MFTAFGKGPRDNDVLIVGLSMKNLTILAAGPLQTMIHVRATEGLPMDVIVLSGPTDNAINAYITEHFPNTVDKP
jgi:hypothetical protein